MIKNVLSLYSLNILVRIILSFSISIWLKLSSKMYISLSLTKDLARAILCFSPPLKLKPFSSITKDAPIGYLEIISSTLVILHILKIYHNQCTFLWSRFHIKYHYIKLHFEIHN